MSEAIRRLLVVGSASVHTWRFLAGIAPRVGEIYLACNGEPPADKRPANLKGELRVDFSLKALGSAGKLKAWIQQIQPDVVHVHQANSVAWHARRALAGSDVPTLLTAWGSDVLLLPRQNRLLRAMVRGNLQAAAAVTSDSLYMAAQIRELAGDCRIALLNYGIDALPPEPAVAAKKKQVLSCRLHKPLYRIDAILKGWAEVERSGRCADWNLVVAASGGETDNLKQLAAALGLKRVEFAGFVDSATLGKLYADSRVFVSVPRSDATSISLLEAMGHGCLPLLSNLPANGEWVIDGLNGAIAEDVSRLGPELLRAMAQAEDDAALQSLAATNRGLVAAKALHQANMAGFADLYRELAADKGRKI
ncbi:glycosyltransferase family 4 protein [Chromobacterium subtsugae]|uniref:Glycosyltransferase family 4 protein n=1 Tax=Chromobacterium subtsugae TaxID=251747 RepID=A0ABS7F9Z8_9NEIS|nr:MULTISPECIES: glycosyltransferase family 4 protein [Chromobacterium]KUM04466.1 glycosyl transferase family 1 [Chromobacterium subtsugae]KZE86094.1 glycosyl transferase family 1 [Chromobacterium sp. F49]MBW7564882.1 glycosyltransferase family 4 protein [Chromobacterium subtsugae]MBW8286591.1 glycosyltransferase family 4 protein [Chromobacterium subtsugae]WSE91368.1 glycosyltransferase family 4 protein [Chromobacterium subtsugae]